MKGLRILELGNYIVPAYAGMILAEQGHSVTKWVNGRDPILSLDRGDELWQWVNHGKELRERHPRDIRDVATGFDIVIDNFRPQTLVEWGISPAAIAMQNRLVWVSMRSEVGDVSFDLLAQCRSWLEYGPYLPFYVGDTVGGLWLAFKALAVQSPGHHVLYHATTMEKLVEGELAVEVKRDGKSVPWDREDYRFEDGHGIVSYKAKTYREPVRDRQWKLDNLKHENGRMII